jgi:DNA-binding response OmpR family regulator
MARILIIDDDETLRDVLSLALEDAGYEVLSASDGESGMKKALQGDVDLIVSDVNMPGTDGFTLCRMLRRKRVTLPIVLLTARDGDVDEALGLDLGADDYIVKPFHTRVLLARIAALLRREEYRAGGAAPRSTRITVGDLDLDTVTMEARYQGTLFVTTVTEFRMLVVLASRPGMAFSRDQMLEQFRHDDSVVTARLVDTYVRRVRRKIELIDPSFDQIETMIGLGYRWRKRD